MKSMKWILVLAVGVASAAFAGAAEPIRVLILSGRNNHDWKTTTPALQKILADSGRFAVDVTDQPGQCDAATLAKYDVLLSNWNNFGSKPGDIDWTPAMRAAFVDFVKSGKGFVSVHAGTSSFGDWPDYQKIGGAWWQNGQTHHDAPHTFGVKMTAVDHPVTRGLAPFTTTDELWMKPGVHPEAVVLATADDQPSAMVTSLGKGRGFIMLLGHDAGRMANSGFQTLLLRGTEWAATGNATITMDDRLLKSLAAYRYGSDRTALFEIARQSQASPGAWATRLSALLDSDATIDAKKFACEQLSIIGGAAEVPALAKRIGDKDLDFAARFALERISGPESLAALRAALPASSGAIRTGLIDALGARSDVAAVPELVKLLPDAAALRALGRIGDLASLNALKAAEKTVPADRAGEWASVMLDCAIKQGDRAMLEQLAAPGHPSAVRVAALMANVSTFGGDGMLRALADPEPAMQNAAIGALRSSGSAIPLGVAASRLEQLTPAVQEKLLAVFGDVGNADVRPAVLKAASSSNAAVALAAISALGSLGDASCVPVLTVRIDPADREARKAIGDALAKLKGAGVDEAIAGALPAASPDAQAVLIAALVDRGGSAAVPALLQLAPSSAKAVNAIGKLGSAGDGARLIALVGKGADADAVEAALIALYRRAGDVQPLVDALGTATGPACAPVLKALGALGGDKALAALRGVLSGGNADSKAAAVRALAEWKDAAPMDDLVGVMAGDADETTKLVAARGLARMADLAANHPAKDVAATLRRAMAAGSADAKAMLAPVLDRFAFGDNLALGATAANVDGLKSDMAGGPPAAAIDGNPTTYWDETDNQKLYQLRVTLKKPATVKVIRIMGFNPASYAPKDFAVVCDGKTIHTVANAQYNGNWLNVPIPPTRCTTVQLDITGYYPASPAIRELEIYGEE